MVGESSYRTTPEVEVVVVVVVEVAVVGDVLALI